MLVLALALACGGGRCQGDGGAAAYGRARERAEELLRAGTPPLDPAFDPVLRDLESVPGDSRFRAPAEALRDRLVAARGLAPRPLARHGNTDDPALAKKEAECVALAQALGRAQPPERDALQQKLDACRADIDRYKERRHHSQTP